MFHLLIFCKGFYLFDVSSNTKIAIVLTSVTVLIYQSIVKDTRMESESQVVQQWKESPL